MRRYIKELILLCVMVLVAVGAQALRPTMGKHAEFPKLTEHLPAKVGPWQYQPTLYNNSYVAVSEDANLDQPYNEVAQRTYFLDGHAPMMLVLAWGQRQRQEVKVHNPELCYKANGFQILRRQSTPLSIRTQSGEQIVAKQMLTQDVQGYEAVTFWVRVGDSYSESSLQTRISIIKHGLRGEVPDGILVRASQRIRSPKEAGQSFAEAARFLEGLYTTLPGTTQSYLVR